MSDIFTPEITCRNLMQKLAARLPQFPFLFYLYILILNIIIHNQIGSRFSLFTNYIHFGIIKSLLPLLYSWPINYIYNLYSLLSFPTSITLISLSSYLPNFFHYIYAVFAVFYLWRLIVFEVFSLHSFEKTMLYTVVRPITKWGQI